MCHCIFCVRWVPVSLHVLCEMGVCVIACFV